MVSWISKRVFIGAGPRCWVNSQLIIDQSSNFPDYWWKPTFQTLKLWSRLFSIYVTLMNIILNQDILDTFEFLSYQRLWLLYVFPQLSQFLVFPQFLQFFSDFLNFLSFFSTFSVFLNFFSFFLIFSVLPQQTLFFYSLFSQSVFSQCVFPKSVFFQGVFSSSSFLEGRGEEEGGGANLFAPSLSQTITSSELVEKISDVHRKEQFVCFSNLARLGPWTGGTLSKRSSQRWPLAPRRRL